MGIFSRNLNHHGSLGSTKKFSGNLAHNIFKLYNALVQIQPTTSKMKRDI